MRKLFVRFALFSLVLLCIAAPARAADEPVEVEAATAPVRLDGHTLLYVAGVSSLPPADRAARISQRLKDVADDRGLAVDTLAVVPVDQGLEIRAGSRLIMTVTEIDARLENAPPGIVAAVHKSQFADAITRYRAERSPARLWRSSPVSLAATAALVAAVWLTILLFRRFDGPLERRYGSLVQAAPGKVGRVFF